MKMKKEVIEAINQDIESALTDVSDMEEILEKNLPEDRIIEKFKMLSVKMANLESILIKEGIL
jgi:hypothetical protein